MVSVRPGKMTSVRHPALSKNSVHVSCYPTDNDGVQRSKYRFFFSFEFWDVFNSSSLSLWKIPRLWNTFSSDLCTQPISHHPPCCSYLNHLSFKTLCTLFFKRRLRHLYKACPLVAISMRTGWEVNSCICSLCKKCLFILTRKWCASYTQNSSLKLTWAL